MRIEEMDKLFGGNQGEDDMQRIARIRGELGITDYEGLSSKLDQTEAEQIERL